MRITNTYLQKPNAMQNQITKEKPLKYEGESCIYWLDEKNVLRLKAKDEIFTEFAINKDYEAVLELIGNKKVKLVYDATRILPIDKNIRLRLEEMLNSIGVALAITSKTRIGNMVANIFFSLSSTKVPMKMFNNHDQAKLWLDTI
ncbi:MAG: hypothetical protein KJ941_02245 [Bacteroidetes bacterium]|nr:hypothetical protein [Bacteroidota bacterium]